MTRVPAVWQQIQNNLKDKLGETVFETWIAPLRLKSDNKGRILLEAPDSFFKDWVERNYRQLIEDELRKSSVEQAISVTIDAGSAPRELSPAELPQSLRARFREPVSTGSLNARY
ncbi:MAG: hypothetical protein KJ793_04485, partial [Candidatus Omnitrophica bacterium]|nr:hypothetical protein [Candidatus Omnitrophota bacterium]